MILRFTIPGDPRGKGRPRFDSRSRRAYTDSKTRAYERWVAARAVGAMAALGTWAELEGPVELEVVAVKARPVALGSGPRQLAPVKPDANNIASAILDGLTKAGAWRDDAQVCRLEAWTYYAASGEAPAVEVVVRSL